MNKSFCMFIRLVVAILMTALFFKIKINSFNQIARKTLTVKSSTGIDLTPNVTLSTAHKVITSWLQFRNIEDSEISSRIILAHALNLGYRKSDFYKSQQQTLHSSVIPSIENSCRLRANNYPLQYIIGNWDFYGKTFECKAPVLIPRPETEELVEHIISNKLLNGIQTPNILDIGSGSGVIGITLLTQYPSAKCIAIDINEVAVGLSNTNAKNLLGNSNQYICLKQSLKEFMKDTNNFGKFDLIVSNPPYIPSKEIKDLQLEVQFEDRIALDGGLDGLDIIKDIIDAYPSLIRMNPHDHRHGELWMEVSEEHPILIEQLLKTNKKCKFISEINDLMGNPRFVRIGLQNS